jgi:hypothetical protein
MREGIELDLFWHLDEVCERGKYRGLAGPGVGIRRKDPLLACRAVFQLYVLSRRLSGYCRV